MKLVYRYILWNLIKTFAISTFVFLFIGFLTRVFHYSSILTEDGGTLLDFGLILLLVQPKIIAALSPFTALVSCFLVYYGLIQTNENTAIYTAGESDLKLLIPFFYFSGFLFAIYLILSSIVIPASYRKMETIHERLAVSFSNSLLKPKSFVEQKGVTIFVNEAKNNKIAEGIIIIDERIPKEKSVIVSNSGNIWFNGESIIFKASDTYIFSETKYSTFPFFSHFKEYLVSFYIKSFASVGGEKSISYQVNKILFQELKKVNPDAIKEFKVRFGAPFFAILIPLSMIISLLIFFNSTRNRISLKNILYTASLLSYVIFSVLFGEIAFNASLSYLFLYFTNIFLIFVFLGFMLKTRIF
jgi:lipopolysaccharide export LptBFGC system permease protein LptF